MIPSYFEFHNPVKILSGEKALENIPFELQSLNARSPIILTNAMLDEVGLLKLLTDAFSNSGIQPCAVYRDIPADSSIQAVNAAASVYREKKCDSIIALGGGSVIDTAKGLLILIANNSSDIMEFMGAETIKKGNKPPFIAIPTTAGTGSEATLVAVIKDEQRHLKMEFISYHLLPHAAVLDPRMTKTLPPRITASTGMDALVHAVEAFTCVQKNPLSDAYAIASIRLVSKYLQEAIRNGSSVEARMGMANAAMMAGAAFSNSMVGLVHAMGHALGGIAGVPHGDAMSILLPHCMRYNKAKLSASYGELLIHLAGADVYARSKPEDRADVLIGFIEELQRILLAEAKLPMKLRDAGVKKEVFSEVVKAAINDGAILMNPVEANAEDILGILNAAY